MSACFPQSCFAGYDQSLWYEGFIVVVCLLNSKNTKQLSKFSRYLKTLKTFLALVSV